jgi:hypothetical protein
MKWEFYNREKFVCPECGEERFCRMVNEKGEFYPDHVGRCDRENSCGYMYHAAQYLKDNPDYRFNQSSLKVAPYKKRVFNGYYHFHEVLLEVYAETSERQTARIFEIFGFESVFKSYLIKELNFKSDEVDSKMALYRMFDIPDPHCIEYNNFLNRTAMLYIYTNYKMEIRAVEQIYYEGFNRSKRFKNNILNKNLTNFAIDGKPYNPETTEINWCLFGEHLTTLYPEKPVVVVEGVKTAFGMSLYYPDINWLATGSSTRLIHLNFRTRHKVHFLPDSGFRNEKSYHEIWKKKIKEMYGVRFDWDITDFNLYCSNEEINQGCDILDIQIKDPDRSKMIIEGLF